MFYRMFLHMRNHIRILVFLLLFAVFLDDIVSDCCLMSSEKFIMARISSFLMITIYMLYLTKTRELYFMLLPNYRKCPQVDMSVQFDILLWLRVNQSLHLFPNVVWLVEKQWISILYSLVWPDRGSNLRLTAYCKYNTTNVV